MSVACASNSSSRITTTISPPTANAMIAYSPYSIPISLWSTVVSHLMTPAGFSSLA